MSMPSSSDAVATSALSCAALQPRFGVEPLLLRQAAVVRRDRVLAEPLAQMAREPLRHPPRVDEDERRPVRLDELGEPVVVLLPDLVRHHRVERRPRQLERRDPSSRRWPSSTIAQSRDRRSTPRVRRGNARPPRSASASPTGRCAAAARRRPAAAARAMSARCAPRRVPITAWISSTMTVRDRAQHVAAALGREQQVQRLGRRHQDVRRRAEHRRALGLRSCRRCARRR